MVKAAVAVAQGKSVGRETESEASLRQTSGSANRNPIRG